MATRTTSSTTAGTTRYDRLMASLAAGRCVVLDGAMGSELIDVVGDRPEVDERRWGVDALFDDPGGVRELHRAYVEAGCDILTTNTWAVPTLVREQHDGGAATAHSRHWMDLVRRGVELARDAADEAGRGDETAVALSLNADLDTEDAADSARLLARALEADPPDLLLLETLALVQPTTLATIAELVGTGIPVWVSFRRCRHGLCGVYGEHWGGPDGDAFGRTARRLEDLGVGALLVNCVPPDHVRGMLSWLRDFTDLPLGAYPNVGYLSTVGWRSDPASVDPAGFADLARRWRAEGAQIVGGCCGVGPAHIRAMASAVAGTAPGRERPSVAGEDRDAAPAAHAPTYRDADGGVSFPLDVPDIVIDRGAPRVSAISAMTWKHVAREGLGAHLRCLDLGCGAGLVTAQLARNGAVHVHAVDADEHATRSALTNAFRNGVADRVSVEVSDVYPWVPVEAYDLVVATVDQVPVDPASTSTSHVRGDFWGRNRIDHVIRMLPRTLSASGVAYLGLLSIIGALDTERRLAGAGLEARVVDVAFVDLGDDLVDSEVQLRRVESASDAYHLEWGGRGTAVAYLLEVSRATPR